MTGRDAIDLSTPRTIHVIGVGGSGMNAIASVLAEMGHRVSGSDLRGGPVADRLAAAGVGVAIGHDAANVPAGVEIVTRSTAVPDDNPEVVACRAAGVEVWSRAAMLAAICRRRPTLAVAGTHGKTTTSSMLALVLRAAGWDPSFVIGADVAGVGSGAHWGGGEWFVVEADESDGTFLELDRVAAVITNVEPDHLEHYGGFEALEAAFVRFASETPGPVVVCADDPGAAAVGDRARAAGVAVSTYGRSAGADVRIVDLRSDRSGVSWRIEGAGDGPIDRPIDVTVAAPGVHHALNATAAVALACELGVDPAVTVDGLAAYRGVARRFERRASAAGVDLVDDYAHLPTEIRAAIAAGRSGGWDRVVAVFQPHRYSRTESLWREFADAFVDADVVVVTDIYPSGEAPRPGVSGELIVDAVRAAHPGTDLRYVADIADLPERLAALLRPGDLCLTLGAGDLTTMPERIAAAVAAAGSAPS